MNKESESHPSDFHEKLASFEITNKEQAIDMEHEAPSYKMDSLIRSNKNILENILESWAKDLIQTSSSERHKSIFFNKQKLENLKTDYEVTRQIIRFHLFNKSPSVQSPSSNLSQIVCLILKCLTSARQFEYQVEQPKNLEGLELHCTKKELLFWMIVFLNKIQIERIDLLKKGKWLNVSTEEKQYVISFDIGVPDDINLTTGTINPLSEISPEKRLHTSEEKCFLRFDIAQNN